MSTRPALVTGGDVGRPEASTAAPRPAVSFDPPPLAVGLLLTLAGVKLLVHLVFGGSYDFHRDELYYLACGRALEWGFVDHPPLVPLLARVVKELAGPSLRALRLVAGLGGTGSSGATSSAG